MPGLGASCRHPGLEVDTSSHWKCSDRIRQGNGIASRRLARNKTHKHLPTHPKTNPPMHPILPFPTHHPCRQQYDQAHRQLHQHHPNMVSPRSKHRKTASCMPCPATRNMREVYRNRIQTFHRVHLTRQKLWPLQDPDAKFAGPECLQHLGDSVGILAPSNLKKNEASPLRPDEMTAMSMNWKCLA